jgi:metal-dependent HD superfamily phosphatase/phosphodiesterase
MITYNEIKTNEDINAYIIKADQSLRALGFTEHAFAHVGLVATRAGEILSSLGYSQREVELVKIASHLHDIGNIVNRKEHSQSGAIIAFRILDKLGMSADEIATIVTAIGNHDEGTGEGVSPIASALIIADKSDVRRTRVRNSDFASFDIHDRVNFSVIGSDLDIDKEGRALILKLEIDTEISPVINYFEIFLNRMLMCQKAAKTLNATFKLVINNQQIM